MQLYTYVYIIHVHTYIVTVVIIKDWEHMYLVWRWVHMSKWGKGKTSNVDTLPIYEVLKKIKLNIKKKMKKKWNLIEEMLWEGFKRSGVGNGGGLD